MTTISFVTGTGSLEHNNRDYVHKNVDPKRIKDNIDYKIEKLEDAYEKCFGKSVEEYNAKQSRNDRKIDNYMKHIEKSGNKEKLFYENIVQIGDMLSHGIGTGNEKQAIDILDKYAKSFQERNPNLYVFNMKMHLDEKTPHLHINYIPVATGYKKGLETRNSLTKAHENMGIEKGTGRNNNTTMRWQQREREYLKELCSEKGLEIEKTDIKREYYKVDDYKVMMSELDRIQKEVIKKVQSKNITTGKVPFTDNVILKKEDYEFLRQQCSKQLEIHEAAKKIANIASKDLSMRFNLSNELENLKNEKNKVNEFYEEQKDLNKLYEKAKEELDKYKDMDIDKILREKEDLAHYLANQMKAINYLVHSEDYGLKEKLSNKEETLINALDKYTQDRLNAMEYNDLAKDVEKYIEISPGIEEVISELEKGLNKSIGLELEL